MAASEAFEALAADPRAQMIDVRTKAEWTFVGVADLSSIGRQTVLAEWQQFPAMAVDPQFAERLTDALAQAGVDRETALFFICRSGARSLAAARAMAQAGFSNCINVSDGFEGDVDEKRHRGGVNGWKAAGLPWVQS
ncbi:MAG: rhodanese-like domain-containing protein [Rhodobiaceae bacterium]|nr:rhodanese-like domain-containing protein [Rhodobiaceae bacterium]MCC0012689.1 rhodanese-like domain-containing protein [Rhodobiaceae bacterium]MCC0018004.1 rhodanese-like domain-containing protein [Rhodobiaceae bacterium]MCC0062044.1 rhodanese-like domain-containing protein [Rhodobiaceae bacterium]